MACDAVASHGEYDDFKCELPEKHPGPHSVRIEMESGFPWRAPVHLVAVWTEDKDV